MTVQYKVWAEIERYDAETDEYTRDSEPEDFGKVFDTYDDARTFLEDLWRSAQ